MAPLCCAQWCQISQGSLLYGKQCGFIQHQMHNGMAFRSSFDSLQRFSSEQPGDRPGNKLEIRAGDARELREVHFAAGKKLGGSKWLSIYCSLKSSRAVPKNTREFDEYIDPAKAEPREVDVEEEGLTNFERVVKEADRARKIQEEEYSRTKPIFLRALGIDPEGYDTEDAREKEEYFDKDEVELEPVISDDDFYSEVSQAVTTRRKQPSNSVKSGNGKSVYSRGFAVDEDEGDEEAAEIDETAAEDIEAIGFQDDEVEAPEEDPEILDMEDPFDSVPSRVALDDLDFESEIPEEEDLKEPTFRMTLAELLDEANVKPLSVEGDLDVEISGIQHDSREVGLGDLFVCCKGLSSDGHHFSSEAVERGAVVLVASKEVLLNKSVKAVVIVEDTNSILSALAGAFYNHPSKRLAVIGITGTNGKTTTSYLLRSVYEAMGLRTGLLGTISYYINSKHKLEAPNTTPDAVYLQKLMAKMVHNGTEACVMEVSSHALALDRCKEVDFDVAVFTNLTRDHMDFHKTEEHYKESKGKLFASMVDPTRHRKVVNIDDPSAPYFIAQGNPMVPTVTFGLENTEADVFPLEVQLSLFETELLVRTPKGNVEISSGLLGRHNVYNILAAIAVGVAVEVPLEHIVRGIEEVDAVPGRCELIDEEQAYAVIVDYAHSPDALARLLDTVRECGARRIITVVGCGGDRDKGKRPIMAKIATDKSDVCLFTSDNPRTEEPLDIIDDMLAGVGWSMEEYLKWGENDYYPPLPNGHRLFVYDIRCIAVRIGVAMGEEGDAVVIAGKGHETYQIVGKEKEYFDDREECREALQHVEALHAAGVDTSELPWRVLESP